MSLTRLTFIATALLFTLTSSLAQELKGHDPLFQSDELLEVTITAPIRTLMSKRPVEEELPGKFLFASDAGEAVELDLQVRARGRFRRDKENCRFPPLRLNFDASQTKHTLFHKQDKLKLVTHCQTSSSYEQTVLREYLVYKILSTLTDNSYRVRLLRITYVDVDEKRKTETRLGFVIEHRERLAKRISRPRVEIGQANLSQLDPAYTNLTSLFHYMIANTDFSPIQAAPNETCCHNSVLFGNADQLFWTIPYDFDQAGLVNARHAAPNPRFKLRSVRQRLYRGRCQFNAQLPKTYALFMEKRAAIMAEIETAALLNRKSRKFMRGFVGEFYKTIESADSAEKMIAKKCI